MPVGGHGGADAQLEEPDLQVTRPIPAVDQDGVPESRDRGGVSPLPLGRPGDPVRHAVAVTCWLARSLAASSGARPTSVSARTSP